MAPHRVICLGLLLLLAACAGSPLSQLVEPAPPKQTTARDEALETGRQMLLLGEYSEAKKHFIRALGNGEGGAAAMTGIGLAEEGQGHLRQAQSFFERALKLAPDSVIAHNNLGVVLVPAGKISRGSAGVSVSLCPVLREKRNRPA